MNFLKMPTYFVLLSMTILTNVALVLSYDCSYSGKVYKANTAFKIGNCTDAYCKADGRLNFTYTCCEYDGHVYQFDADFEDKDCYRGHCFNDGNVAFSKRCCLYEGKEYQLGTAHDIDDCSSVLCLEDGEAFLEMSSCPESDCGPRHKVPGVCCPVCDGE